MFPSPTRHEDRFVAILQHAVHEVEVVQEVSIPRKARKLDALVRLADAPELFGALRPWLRARTVVFEHESAPLTNEAVASAALGPPWLHWHRLRRDAHRASAVRRAVAGTDRPPIGVVVADRVAQEMNAAIPGLRPADWPGVWSTPHLDEGGLVVLDTSQLAGIPGFEFWAWLGGASTPEEGARRMRLLLESPSLSTLTLNRLNEAIMNERIPTTSAEQETNYQRITRLARDEGREEALSSFRELLRRYAPERVAELSEVRDPEVLRHALDEAIQQRLAGR
jgi:hypothetical protein